MGLSTKWGFRQFSRESNVAPGQLPAEFIETFWPDFDHGTQRAILKLYRSAPPDVLARAGERLGELRCPAPCCGRRETRTFRSNSGQRYADALGGEAELELVEAGHWMWLDRPDLVERVAGFLGHQRLH